MSDNEDGTRSPLYYNYNFESSMVYAAMTRYYDKKREKGHVESLDELLDSIFSRGIFPGQLKTHQDRAYFKRLIPVAIRKLFDEGEIGHIYQQMLINRQKKDTKEYNRNLLNNTLGSWIAKGKRLSVDRLNNVNLKKIFNFGGK